MESLSKNLVTHVTIVTFSFPEINNMETRARFKGFF